MGNHPSGTVTFLFTDIEGSTKLAQEHPDKWESWRERHHAILQSAIEAHNGYIFQIIGDAFCAAFHTALDALNAAVKAQQLLQQEEWSPAPIKVRMGINTGTAQVDNGDDRSGGYKGYTAMARVQRLMSVGYGGQILLSNSSFELVRGELPHQVSLRDMGEHRLKGLLNPEHLWQVIVPNMPQDFPPLQSLNKIPNNLPVQLTSFVGREKEIEEIKQELNNHRLVTLTGSGGTGKTRLSLQVAAEVLDQYPDGVWFIELAPLADPDLIPHTILAVLHFGEQAGKTPLQVLEEQFKHKKLLLILDNCEHLIEASTKVVHALLMSAPEIRILATSREALGVKGELAWHVPSLALPDPKSLPELEQLTQYESVRLFIERALLVQPHFKVDQANAPAIAQICSRLDGIPLAIELAAARLKMLSVDQIAARLDDRFRLLTGGARTAIPRQQTLRGMIDWSYDLLAENEKLLLRRLAVFSGGWRLELAEQICSDDQLNSLDILDMLGHLVDKSLVAVDEDKTGTRYRILETVRQYAHEKLFETDEHKAIRNKHRDVYLAFVERIEPEIIRAQQKKWLNVLEAEIDNFRLAFSWSLENKDIEQALRFCSGLANFWGKNEHTVEASETTKQALAQVNENDDLNNTLWYATTLLAYVAFTRSMEWKSFSDPSFLPLLLRSQTLFESLNSYSTTAPLIASASLSFAYIDLNDFAAAEKCLLDMYEKVTLVEYEWGIAWSKQHLAELSLRRGDFFAYLTHLQEALELFSEFGDEWSVKNITETLIWQKYLRGEIEDANKLTNQNLLLYKKDGELDRIAGSYDTLGAIALLRGEYETAQEYFSDAIKIYAEHGFRGRESLARGNLAFLLCKEGRLDESRIKYQEIINQLRGLSESMVFGVIHAHYALLCLCENRVIEAQKSLESALVVLQKTAPEDDVYHAYFGFGELARLKNNYPEAIKNYSASLQYANNFLNYKSFPEIFDGIAKTECLQLNSNKAARLFGASEALRKKMGAVIHPVDRPDYDRHIKLLHEKMNPEELESAWAEGAKMSIEEMLAFATETKND